MISMLPPPITERLRRFTRSEFRALACSGVVAAPGMGVTDRVPVSCAYEYRMSSALD